MIAATSTMMVLGWLMMVPWPPRRVPVDLTAVAPLREAFPMQPAPPRDMRALTFKIGRPFRLIDGGRR